MIRAILLLCLTGLSAGGCASAPAGAPAPTPGSVDTPGSVATPGRSPTPTSGGWSGGGGAASHSSGSQATVPAGAVVAYVNGQPLQQGDLWPLLAEAQGGVVLSEVVLDRRLRERLGQGGLTVSEAELADERALLVQALDEDPDQAQRLLDALRTRRGLGPRRFERLLWRSAALRKLVAPEVEVTAEAVEQAYQFEYGPRYEARLILVPRLREAADLARQIREGASFIELAARHSTDPGGAAGGYLGQVSPLDPTLPVALRQALTQLEDGQVSEPVAIENGFALLKVERKIPPREVALDDVKERLTAQVRQGLERARMQQLADQLRAAADVVVLDADLEGSWRQQQVAGEDQ